MEQACGKKVLNHGKVIYYTSFRLPWTVLHFGRTFGIFCSGRVVLDSVTSRSDIFGSTREKCRFGNFRPRSGSFGLCRRSDIFGSTREKCSFGNFRLRSGSFGLCRRSDIFGSTREKCSFGNFRLRSGSFGLRRQSSGNLIRSRVVHFLSKSGDFLSFSGQTQQFCA